MTRPFKLELEGSSYLQVGRATFSESLEGADLSEKLPLSFLRCPLGGARESLGNERRDDLLLCDLRNCEEEEDKALRKSGDLEEEATLSDPVRVKTEEGSSGDGEAAVLEEEPEAFCGV